MTTAREPAALRRAVLAITLLDQGALADLEVVDGGVQRRRVDRRRPSSAWDELLLAGGDPADDAAEPVRRRRVARWLRVRARCCTTSSTARTYRTATPPRSRSRPASGPAACRATTPCTRGPRWPRRTILGGALDLGLALRGIDDDGRGDPEAVGILPAGMLEAAGIDAARRRRPGRALPRGHGCARRRSDSASTPRRSCARSATPTSSRCSPRAPTAWRCSTVQGMRSAAVPVRTRGWLDLGRLDPAFAVSAAEITDPDDRGFPRPVLVTRDEVALVQRGRRPDRAVARRPGAAGAR